MSVTIRLRPNGPLVVEGPVTIVDQNGNPFPLNPDKPAVALCRCGALGQQAVLRRHAQDVRIPVGRDRADARRVTFIDKFSPSASPAARQRVDR